MPCEVEFSLIHHILGAVVFQPGLRRVVSVCLSEFPGPLPRTVGLYVCFVWVRVLSVCGKRLSRELLRPLNELS